jgi:hypothetical protein
MVIPASPPPPPGADRPERGFVPRIIGAARLDPRVYEDVEADLGATSQALAVVVLSSAAAAIGARTTLNGLVVGVLASIFMWYVWAVLTWWIGTRLLPEPETSATQGELLRTLGFATAPGMLQILGIIPALRWLSVAVAAVWMLAAGIVAVRQALDYRSTGRAIAVVGIGWLVQLAVLVFIRALTGVAH